jgi:glucose-1-phosphatase
MNQNRIRCIFFDLGKVLVDLDYSKFRDRMISLTGLKIEQLRAAFNAGDSVSKIELGLCSDREFLSEISGRIGVKIDFGEFLEAWTGIFAERPLVSAAMLRDLSKVHSIWGISNTNRMHFCFLRKRFRFLEDHFQGWILSYEVGLAKPDPAIFRLALRKAGVAAFEALFIDDRAENVESALKLGMDALQFKNPDQLIGALQERGILTSSYSEYYR